MAVLVGFVAANITRYGGYPAEGWLAAEWSRQAAEETEDPVMEGVAALARV